VFGKDFERKSGPESRFSGLLMRPFGRSILRERQAWHFCNFFTRFWVKSCRINEVAAFRESGPEGVFVAWAPQPEFNFRKPKV
jgi:hypothetical protein